MPGRDLTPQQLDKLKRIIGRNLRFYTRLVERIDAMHFEVDDPLRLAALRAREGTHWLSVELHYASCQSGVGR
jgi:hypothetical protein